MIDPGKFIEIFGVTVWVCQKIIAFSGLADQFKEYWTSSYKAEKEDKE